MGSQALALASSTLLLLLLLLCGAGALEEVQALIRGGLRSGDSAAFDAGAATRRATALTTPGSAWDCNRPWPDLELFLPINTNHHTRDPKRDSEFNTVFLRSLLMFWPLEISRTKLLLVADAENRETPHTKEVHKILLDVVAPHVPGGVRMDYNEPLSIDRNRGHDRQQRLMFYADVYSSAEYVGFVDTDCMFVTYVDREDVFEGGKPVVIGRIGNFLSPDNGPGYDWWATIPKTTYEILGIKEPMRCMSYFPMVVKTTHIKAMRQYMEKRHGKPFDTVFQTKFIDHAYSQFNVMCAYLFQFHRDEYVWYVNDISPQWNGKSPAPVVGQDADPQLFSAAMRVPKPRIAMHSNYWSPKQQHMGERDEENILRTGLCVGPPFPKPQHYSQCDFYTTETQQKQVVYEEMFKYEMVNWLKYLPQGQAELALQQRLERIRHCNHTYIHPDLKQLMSP